MTCREVRELLFAFLDNELDGALSIEVQRHLDHCCDCVHEAEIEHEIRKQLKLSLAPGMPETGTEDAELTRILSSSPSSRDAVWWRWKNAAWAASVLAIISVAGLWWHVHRARPSTISSLISSSLIVDDYQEFLNRGRPVEIASGDAAAVASWIHREMDLPAQLPVMHGQCKLVGARRCTLSGRTAALVLYETPRAPASLLILAGQPSDLRGMRNRGTHWADECKGHTIVASHRDGLVYAAVGMLPEQELDELVPQ